MTNVQGGIRCNYCVLIAKFVCVCVFVFVVCVCGVCVCVGVCGVWWVCVVCVM
jgi:hypothetical protein